MYHDTKFPEAIAAAFPEATKERYTNGVISFSKTFSHLKNFKLCLKTM
jgi:hypothetical protein